jgi:antitoxin component YwqK of YwqJK toxin-antitoxin module
MSKKVLRPSPVEKIQITKVQIWSLAGIIALLLLCGFYAAFLSKEYRREFYEDGTLKYEAQYKDGLLDGKKQGYYPTGELKVVSHYRENKLHGPYRELYENGQIKVLAYYENGQKHGDYQSFYEDGSSEIKGNYVDGLADGDFKEWNRDGNMRLDASFKKGLLAYIRHKLVIEPLGEEYRKIYWKDNKKIKSQWFNRREELKLETLWDGETEKRMTVFYERGPGKGKVSKQCDYPARKRKYCRHFDENGRLNSEGLYRDEELAFSDVKIGVWKYYKEDGSLLRTEDNGGVEKTL